MSRYLMRVTLGEPAVQFAWSVDNLDLINVFIQKIFELTELNFS